MLCTWTKAHLHFTGACTTVTLNPSVCYLHGQSEGTDVFLHQRPHSAFSMSLVFLLSQDASLKTQDVEKQEEKGEPSIEMQLY